MDLETKEFGNFVFTATLWIFTISIGCRIIDLLDIILVILKKQL